MSPTASPPAALPAGLTLMHRRLIALGALSLATGGAAGLVMWQARADRARAEQKTADHRLVSLAEAERIERIELNNGNGQFVLAKGADSGAWRLSAPHALAADGQAVQTLLSALVDGQLKRTVVENDAGADFGLFGLAQPALTVVLTGPDKQRARLEVGGKNTFDNTLFARRDGRHEVVGVDSSLEQALGRTLFDLRDKQVLHLPSQAVASIAVQPADGPAYRLAREAGAYRLTQPLSAPADKGQAEALVQALLGLRAQDFLAEAAADDSSRQPFGLHRPAYVVDLTDDTGAHERLRVARSRHKPAQLVVQAGDLGPVAEISSDWVAKKLGVSSWELRDKHLLGVAADQVRRLVLEEPAARLELSRGAAEAGERGVWRLADGTEADGERVDGMLRRLVELEAAGVVHEAATAAQATAAGLDAPTLKITLAGGGEGEEPLATLAVAEERDGSRRAGRGAGSPLWRVSPASLAGIGSERALVLPAAAPPAAQASTP